MLYSQYTYSTNSHHQTNLQPNFIRYQHYSLAIQFWKNMLTLNNKSIKPLCAHISHSWRDCQKECGAHPCLPTTRSNSRATTHQRQHRFHLHHRRWNKLQPTWTRTRVRADPSPCSLPRTRWRVSPIKWRAIIR